VEYEWVFERAGERLIVQRWRRPDRVWELSVIWPSGERETEGYVDFGALSAIHARLERELARSGWSLHEFSPERRRVTRRGRERAASPATDRRKLGRLTPLRVRVSRSTVHSRQSRGRKLR
jgi:hypothetical protein